MKYSRTRATALLCAVGMLISSFAMAEDGRYIIQFAPGAAGNGKAAVQAMGGDIKVDLTDESVNAIAVTLPGQAVQALQNNPNVRLIEEDPLRYPMGEVSPYGIGMVQADQFVEGASAADIKVCIIDSGIDANHEDLKGNFLSKTDDDGTGNAYVDGCGHGTHVAGTIGAIGGNGLGVVGVNSAGAIGLHIIKYFGNDCSASYSSDLAAAAYQCRDAGAKVINMSLGCTDSGRGGPWATCSSSTEEAAFQDLYNNFGVLSIAAAGNDGNTNYSYPGSYPVVMSVAAVDENKAIADFSQQNDQVEISGPGVGVLSTVPTGTGFNISVTDNAVGDGFEATAMQGTTLGSASGTLADCGDSGAFTAGVACAGSGGHVCLIERGSISFEDKVLNCEASGGVAAIIYNNASGMVQGALSDPTATTIPAVGVSQDSGVTLTSRTGNQVTVTVESGNYDYYNGTSMATPHVAGVAALVWSHNSAWTPDEIRNALTSTAEDLGDPGVDNAFGYGLVRAKAALDALTGGGGGTNAAPTASFTFNCTDLACNFDGSASSDSDGTIASYAWNFGDGNTATGATASHTYGGDGSYTVTLTVTDDDGATGSDSSAVTVSGGTEPVNEAPTASFGSNCTDLACTFDGSASSDSDGSIASYAWDFGDGNSATGQTTSHSYAAGGTFTVTLTVTDDAGATDTASQNVTVTEPSTGGVTLTANGYKNKGRWTTDLNWSGASSTDVDIYRDGTLLITMSNSGSYTDATDFRGGGSLTYQVCEAGTSTCSDIVTVVF